MMRGGSDPSLSLKAGRWLRREKTLKLIEQCYKMRFSASQLSLQLLRTERKRHKPSVNRLWKLDSRLKTLAERWKKSKKTSNKGGELCIPSA